MRSRNFLNNIRMRPKLIGLFLIVGLIPLIVLDLERLLSEPGITVYEEV